MRIILLFIVLVFSSQSYANEHLTNECDALLQKNATDFSYFRLKTAIKLGECLGVKQLKEGQSIALKEACEEVKEDSESMVSYLNLSMVEAIKIGQCAGIINYIYNNYNRASYQDPDLNENRYRYTNTYKNRYKYKCKKETNALTAILSSNERKYITSTILKILCAKGY